MKEYFRLDEVARILDVSKRTVERLIECKELGSTKHRGCTRVHRTDLEEYQKKKKKRV